MRIFPYLPEKTKEFQNTIRFMVREYMSEFDISEFPKDVPLMVTARFFLPRPASAKKRIAPIVRPDLSNYFKALEDGIQREAKDGLPALVEDDSSICAFYAEKRYVDEEHPTPGILVEISEWSPDGG
jgi:Holliday junction resolvase RusA-like endonuclease